MKVFLSFLAVVLGTVALCAVIVVVVGWRHVDNLCDSIPPPDRVILFTVASRTVTVDC